jgi:purine nucleoside permease
MRRLAVLACLFACISSGLAAASAIAAPLEVRVVVVTAFEIGADTGDKAGEFQAWAQVMPQKIPFKVGFRDLRYDPAKKTLLLSTSMGTNRAAISTMALGLDPRFDLSKAYWLVAAIAGVNPNQGSVGSAAWIGAVIDSDFGYTIDPRETPKAWAIGQIPFHRKAPYEGPPAPDSENLFPLNTSLRDWAFDLTRDAAIPDNDALKALRTPYVGLPKAQTPPMVLKGDEVSGQAFWHGEILNRHYEAWANYWTGDQDGFVMTGMEDTGVLGALDALGRVGRVDPKRVLVLRTASNYTTPPPGGDAATNLLGEHTGVPALQSSLDAAFKVGGVVVDELVKNWPRYADAVPGK